ncbi:MAG TPA: DUF2232 domain-containing protein [Thermoanaerobaculia bacterium]|nr:DUF2232 domain-containing protein [Thermoanaerobaculia bacterium]
MSTIPPQAELRTGSGARTARSTAGHALLTAMLIVTQFTIFIPAALLNCALRNGRRAAWAAFAIAAALAGLASAATIGTADAKLFASYIAAIVLSHALPPMLLLPLVERRQSYGELVVLMLSGAAAGLGLTEVGTRLFAGFSLYALQVEQSKAAANVMLAKYRTAGTPAEALQGLERWFGYCTTHLVASGLLLTAAVAFILSMLMVGRLEAWRTRRTGTVSGTYLFRNFALPDWLLFAFVIGGLTPLAHGFLQTVAANVLAVVIFLFIVQGFALFRFLLAAMGVGFLGALIASVFVLASGVGAILLGIAGLFDPFFDFRHLQKRKDDSHESHSD